MPLQKLFDNASATAEGVFTSSAYEFVDSEPRQLFIGGKIGESLITIALSPDGREWFPLRSVDSKTVIVVQAQAGTLLHLTLARDPNARVNAWI